MAVDIGSTTVAAHLCNLESGELAAAAGVMNPQIRFGEDLMSRVSYAMMNPGGAAKMTEAIREALSALAAELAREAGIELTDILELTLVGNPIMHHLVLGIDPVELGGAPFALAVDQALTLPASSLGIAVNPEARVYILPCIAGHVGADAAGVILAERPDQGDEITLLVDVGTNAEIVLGNRERLLACSSPTGPAFEGAQISCGQRAAPGAIERVRIDPATLEPRYKVIGSELWSDDPGFAAATARTGVTGVCGSGIIEVIAGMYLAGVINQDGVIDGALASRSDRIVADGRTFSYVLHRGDVPMKITQTDVRAIQLAKAALYAGVALLMDHTRHRARGSHPPRRRLRQPHRREVRDGPRPHPRLRPEVPSPRPATPPAPGRASRSSTRPPAPRSRNSSAASRRSRPPSSRASRRISSRRWRFRTRPRPILSCARP